MLLLWAVAWQPAAAQPGTPAKSPPEAVNIYTDAANFQNNGAFELAAEEWEKFLQKYPDDPLAVKARYYAGVSYLQLKRYEQAAAAFGEVVRRHPNFELIEDAYLNLGWSLYSLGQQGAPEQYEKAAASLVELVRKFPNGKHTDQALFFLGETRYAQKQLKEAAAAYSQLIRHFPQSQIRCDALYALGVAHEDLKEYAAAEQTYNQFLQLCGENELAAEVRLRKAETVLQQQRFADAEQLFAEVAANPNYAARDQALLRQAYAVARQEQYARAAQLYQQVPQQFPQSSYADEARMAAARSYYLAKDFSQAERLLQDIVQSGNTHAIEAAHWLSRIWLDRRQPQQVAELAGPLLAANGESPYRVHLMLDYADALYQNANSKEQALAQYLKIASEHGSHELASQALYNAAFTAMELGQHDQAVQHVQQFLQQYPQDRLLPDVRYVAAESLLLRAQHAQAEQAFRQLADTYTQHPDNGRWKVRLGLTLYLQKKYDEVSSVLGSLTEQLPTPELRAEALFLLGASQLNQQNGPEAERLLKASLEASGNWRQADEVLLHLSRAQHLAGKTAEARTTVQQLIDGFPQSTLLDHARYRLGQYAYDAGDFSAARQNYEQVLQNWPNSPLAPFALHGSGWAALKAGDFAAAAEAFSRLIQNQPQHELTADAYLARAMCRRQLKQYSEALADLQSFLKTDPTPARRSDALYEMALVQVAMDQHQAAAATLAGLLENNPSYEQADRVLYELGWAYQNSQQPDQAAAAFARLAKEHPQSPLIAEALFHVGQKQYDAQQYEQAGESYAQAFEQAQDASLKEKTLYKWGWAAFQQKKYEEALERFQRQATSYPAGELITDARFMVAESLFRLNRHSEALPALEQVLQGPLPNEQIETLALLHAGQSAGQLKQWDKSLSYLEQIPQKFADSPYASEAWYEIGWARQQLGRLAEALPAYEKAAESSRGEVGARARFMMGEIYFAQRQHDEAIRQFQRVMYGFGGERAAAEVKNWQAKAAYEAARCAEVQVLQAKDARQKQQLVADARKYYTFVVEKHPQSDLASQAANRLKELTQL